MKLRDLTERFERARAVIRPDELEQMYAELGEVLDRWDVVETAPACDMCKGTGIATVITSPPHIAPAQTKEIQCPKGCNRAHIEDILRQSREALMQESAKAIEAAKNPPMPPVMRVYDSDGRLRQGRIINRK